MGAAQQLGTNRRSNKAPPRNGRTPSFRWPTLPLAGLLSLVILCPSGSWADSSSVHISATVLPRDRCALNSGAAALLWPADGTNPLPASASSALQLRCQGASAVSHYRLSVSPSWNTPGEASSLQVTPASGSIARLSSQTLRLDAQGQPPASPAPVTVTFLP